MYYSQCRKQLDHWFTTEKNANKDHTFSYHDDWSKYNTWTWIFMSYLFPTYELFFKYGVQLPSKPNHVNQGRNWKWIQFHVIFHEKDSRCVFTSYIHVTLSTFLLPLNNRTFPGAIDAPLDFLGFKTWVNLSQYLNTLPWRGNLASGQVDFQFTCPDGQVEILDKTMVIKMNNDDLGKLIFIWAGQIMVYSSGRAS